MFTVSLSFSFLFSAGKALALERWRRRPPAWGGGKTSYPPVLSHPLASCWRCNHGSVGLVSSFKM